MQAPEVLQWSFRIAAVGIVIDTLERLATWRSYRDDGAFAWTLLRQRIAWCSASARGLADVLCRGAGPLGFVLALRLVAVLAAAVLPIDTAGFAVGLTIVVVTHWYVAVRSAGLGANGSDAMLLVVCGAAWIGLVPTRDPLVVRMAVWFIVAQACLGYVTAGVSKAVAPKWRSGAAMIGITSTELFGSRALHETLSRRPRLAQFICWSTILWEALFPLALVVPGWMALAIFAMGVVFHVGNAVLMGLNVFPWAFCATYGAVWWAREVIAA